MKQLDMGGKCQCMVYSAAMILDKTPRQIESVLGVTGMEVWWIQFNDLRRFRGLHEQEIIDIGLHFGYAVSLIQIDPLLSPDSTLSEDLAKPAYSSGRERLRRLMASSKGMVIAQMDNKRFEAYHAYAWDSGELLDPRGMAANIEDINIIAYLMFSKIQVKSKTKSKSKSKPLGSTL